MKRQKTSVTVTRFIAALDDPDGRKECRSPPKEIIEVSARDVR